MDDYSELTQRHRDCLQHIADGFDVEQIAGKCHSTVAGVEATLAECRKVLATKDDGHSVAVALRRKLIT